jgi:osmotically-inducible protein OsmY
MIRKLRWMGLGALVAYFFDPQNGRSRRAEARQRIPAMLRRSTAKAGQAGKAASSQATAVKAKAANRKEAEKPQPDDVTLARKVETEIFRDDDVPKGKINVNAENGKVVLRGEVDEPSLIDDLEKRTKKVQGVREVENLLTAAAS